MPIERFQVQKIESYLPSVDARNVEDTFVIDGRNFVFDSLGPKSGFSTKQLTPFGMTAPVDVQGIHVSDNTFVFTNDAILIWRDTPPYTWELLYAFGSPVANASRWPWSAIFLNGQYFLAHPARGFFSALEQNGTKKLWLHPQTTASIPGLITAVRGMGVVRSRAIICNKTSIQWSDTSDMSDLTPGIAGAGFQLIRNFVQGEFIKLTTYQDGFIVWTTGGAILAEFIGGDNTFRFVPYPSEEQPLGPWAITSLANDATVFLSRRGLIIATNTESPKAWTPEINEFLRDYIPDQLGTRQFRLEYDRNRERIFLMESVDGLRYWRALVLSTTLNKWGIFSDPTYGMLPLTNQLFGYVGGDGIPHYFSDTYWREREPDNEMGANRCSVRSQKQMSILSSSAVSRACEPDPTMLMNPVYVPTDGWYVMHCDSPAFSYAGMDSWVEVGFLRPGQLSPTADSLLEVQEIVLGSVPTAPPAVNDFTTDWKADFFYPESEDWGTTEVISEVDSTEDLNTSTDPDEDLNELGDYDHIDLGAFLIREVVFGPVTTEDWNEDGVAEDWNSIPSSLPNLSYGIVLKSSQDGITFDESTPALARFDLGARTFSILTSGTLHTLRIEATNPNEFYRIQSLDVTMNYVGQLV